MAEVDWPDLLVVVAVDGPDPVLESIALERGAKVVVLASNQGSYAARNAAIDELPQDIDIVAFTDSDCIPSTGWIREHVEALADADMSGGGIEVTLRDKPSAAEFVDRFRHLKQELYVHGDGYAATANLAVNRRVLAELRFDPRLRSGGDNDFGRRAREAGFSLVYSPGASVEHPARRSDVEVRRKVHRILDGIRANPTRWNIRPVPFPPVKPRIANAAWNQGASRNLVWLLHAWLLQLWADWVIHRTVSRIRRTLFAAVSAAPMRVGYLVDGYPKISETFVINEIEEMQRVGVGIAVVAVRQGEVKVAAAPTHFLQIPSGRIASTGHILRWLLLHPGRFLTCLRRLRRIGWEAGEGDNRFRHRTVFEAASILRTADVEVLHAHFAWGGAAAAYCIAALLDVPWTMTLHANDFFSDRRHLEVKLDSADRLVTVCDYNVDYLRDELGVTRDLHLVICGVEVPDQVKRKTDVDIVAVGRLVEKKGFDLLIAAAAQLRKRRRALSVEIIGSGKLAVELESLVEDHGLEETVRFRGAMPHAQVLERIAAGRVFALPARIAANGDRDSMPVVIKEALIRGVPVVATDVVAIPEMVDDEVGRLVPPDDADALAKALSELLRLSDAKLMQIGERGRDRARQRFTLEAEVAKLKAILEGAIAERSDKGEGR